jgi:RsiW-degrading membrane proteinase PrsW (M82 family)
MDKNFKKLNDMIERRFYLKKETARYRRCTTIGIGTLFSRIWQRALSSSQFHAMLAALK